MIDRKTLWFAGLLITAMLAAAMWRLSLLPDWTQVPIVTPNGLRIKHGLVLFIPPASLIFMITTCVGSKWLVSGPADAIQAYQNRNRMMILGMGAVMALSQAFLLSRSLGYGQGLNGEAITRATMIVVAFLVMLQGNNMPKLPWLTSRFPALQLDPWQSARAKRFTARMSILYGLAIIVTGTLLPLRTIGPTVLILCPLYLAALVWYTVRLKREPASSLSLTGWSKE